MPRYRQKNIEVDAIRLEYQTLLQTPEGAMSAAPGDYLETIRGEGQVHQRIVPAWVFEMGHEKVKKAKHKDHCLIPKVDLSPEEIVGIAERIGHRIENAMTLGEPHDGYPLTRE